MGKLDKDRYLKELSVRYCLAAGMVPFAEVLVSSASDLSDSPEVLTDLDVVGLKSSADGTLSRTLFDCKSGKMSAVNRAFWAGGVSRYAGCNEAFVILKTRPLHNHRISALTLGIDLHDELSFVDLGQTFDPAFPGETHYQSTFANWDRLDEAYDKYSWSGAFRSALRNIVPLTRSPSAAFRRVIADLKNCKGEFDPAKKEHQAIFLDVLSGLLVLWATIGRDIRRFYEPKMSRSEFEKIMRYYFWGGRESYRVRQKLAELGPNEAGNGLIELPAWPQLVGLASTLVAAPQAILSSALICREISIRTAAGRDPEIDIRLAASVAANGRFRQFSSAMTDYVISATGIPRDLGRAANHLILHPTS